MWRLILTAALLLLILALPPPVEASDGLIDRLLVHVNQMRVDHNLPALSWSAELTWAAGAGVTDMAARSYLAHTSPEGVTAAQRGARAGYGTQVAEVLARGSRDPSELMRAWMDSDDHRRALLWPEARDVGLWTEMGPDGVPYVGVMLGDRIQEPVGTRIVRLARGYVGTAYRWGGLMPEAGFDCAGLVTWVYHMAGISLQTTWIAAWWERYPRIERDGWLPGDVVILANTYKAGISHAGIYSGDGRMIHASGYSAGVMESGLAGHGDIVGAVRPWE